MYPSSFLEACVAPHTNTYDSYSEISKRVIYGNTVSIENFPRDNKFSVVLDSDAITAHRVNFADNRRRRDEAATLIAWFTHIASKTQAPIDSSLLHGTILPSWSAQLAPFNLSDFHLSADTPEGLSTPSDFLRCGLSHLCDVSIYPCTHHPNAAMASYGDNWFVLTFDVRKRFFSKAHYVSQFHIEVFSTDVVHQTTAEDSQEQSTTIAQETGHFVTPFHILSDIWDFRHFAIERLPITKEAWETYHASTER